MFEIFLSMFSLLKGIKKCYDMDCDMVHQLNFFFFFFLISVNFKMKTLTQCVRGVQFSLIFKGFFEGCWRFTCDDAFWENVPVADSSGIEAVFMVISAGLWYVVSERVFGAGR